MNPYVLGMLGKLPPVVDSSSTGDRGYISSFDYYRDDSSGPPPASDGGPTASQLFYQEGLVDDKGYLLSNPGLHSTIAAMYGLDFGKQTSSNPATAPDYDAGMLGDTLGGIGNTDGTGNDILWSNPFTGALGEGDIFETPAGSYKVMVDPWGGFYLSPIDDAIRGMSPQLTNLTQGEHHLGINPFTGEVWYQQAAGYNNFSGGDYYQNPQAPVAPNSPANASGVSTPGVGTSSGGDLTTAGSAKAPLAKSSWLDVLNRQGRDLESWDPYLGTFTGLSQNPDWTQMNAQQAQDSFNNIWNQGLFSGLSQADVYADLLKRLGFGV